MPAPPPRNPPPRTASAKAALAHFYCELCGKGYARMNEWEAHEGSYDHQHRKRLKDLKQMQKEPGANDRARRNEERSAGMISIKLGSGGGGAGAGVDKTQSSGVGSDGGLPLKAGAGGQGKRFKKAGFKSAFGGGAVSVPLSVKESGNETAVAVLESESEEDGDEGKYDPKRPTECAATCLGRLEG